MSITIASITASVTGPTSTGVREGRDVSVTVGLSDGRTIIGAATVDADGDVYGNAMDMWADHALITLVDLVPYADDWSMRTVDLVMAEVCAAARKSA